MKYLLDLKLSEFLLVISSFLIALYSVQGFTKYAIGNTAFWYSVCAVLIVLFYFDWRRARNDFDAIGAKAFKWYLFWTWFCILHGVCVAHGYWQWKSLISNVFCILLPICLSISGDARRFVDVMGFYWRYVMPCSLIILFCALGGYGLYLALIPFLILFLPYVSHWKKILLLAFATSVLIFDPSYRSVVIKLVIPLLLSMGYVLRNVISLRIYEVLRKLLFLIPLILFGVGVAGVFNVFDMSSYYSNGREVSRRDAVTGEVETRDIRSDTRSFVYREVLATTMKYNSWLIGRTPAHGNETEAFAGDAFIYSEQGLPERPMNEASIPNVFMWLGLVGLLIYSFIFYRSSYCAINFSKSYFSKSLGIFIAFRWAYGWAEEINNFSLSYFSLWLMIGGGMSFWLRDLDDDGVRQLARRVFSYKSLSDVVK